MIKYCIVCGKPGLAEGAADRVTHGICSDYCRKVFARWKTKPYPKATLRDFYVAIKELESHGLDHLWLGKAC